MLTLSPNIILNTIQEEQFKKEYDLENNTDKEIDTKLNNVLNDVKNFCSLQIKTVSDNYEKLNDSYCINDINLTLALKMIKSSIFDKIGN